MVFQGRLDRCAIYSVNLFFKTVPAPWLHIKRDTIPLFLIPLGNLVVGSIPPDKVIN